MHIKLASASASALQQVGTHLVLEVDIRVGLLGLQAPQGAVVRPRRLLLAATGGEWACKSGRGVGGATHVGATGRGRLLAPPPPARTWTRSRRQLSMQAQAHTVLPAALLLPPAATHATLLASPALPTCRTALNTQSTVGHSHTRVLRLEQPPTAHKQTNSPPVKQLSVRPAPVDHDLGLPLALLLGHAAVPGE